MANCSWCVNGSLASPLRLGVLAGVYGAGLLGLPLNAGALWVLLRHHGAKSASAVLMTNLAASDLLLGLALALRVPYYVRGGWALGRAACVGATLLFRLNVRGSSAFITLISADRLLAVGFPLRGRRLRSVAWAWRACGGVWLLFGALAVPEAALMHRALPAGRCFEVATATPWAAPVQSALVLALLLANVACTALVARALCARRGGGAGGGAPSTRRTLLIFAVNLLMFAVFFVPLSAALLGGAGPETLHAVICLASLNSCLDPVVYYFSLEGFWRTHPNTNTEVCD